MSETIKDWFDTEINKQEEQQKEEVVQVSTESSAEVVDGIIFEDLVVETDEERFERLKEEEIRRARSAALEKQAKEDALRQFQEETGIGFVVEEKTKKKIGRTPIELSEKQLWAKTEQTMQKLQDTVDEVATAGLDSNDIPESVVNEARDVEFETKFARSWNIQETIIEDLTIGRKPKEWQTDETLLGILDYIIYVFGYNKLTSEVYKERTKNVLHKVLMNPHKYANYRHAFRNESYDAIMGLIPRHIKIDYSPEYLKDTFILLNVIYKYGENAIMLDVGDVIDVILANNDHLPATVKYQKPYTREFLLDLSMYHVFTNIQNLCVDEQAIQQVSLLLGMVTERLQQWKDSGEQNTQEMKQAAETLDKLDKINAAHRAQSESTNDSVVLRVPDKGLDYTKFLHIVPYTAGKLKDRKFVYYISVNKQNDKGINEFVGWIAGINNTITRDNIRIFSDEVEVTRVFNDINNDPDTPNNLVLTINRLDTLEDDITILADSVKEEE